MTLDRFFLLLFLTGQIGRFFTSAARLLGLTEDLFQKELKDDEGPSLGKTDV